MKTLNVELGTRSYPIYIGTNLLQQPDLLERHLKGRRTLIVSNTTVAPLYLQTLMPAGCEKVILPDGEQYKTLESLNQIFTCLLEKNYDRQSVLIALGGGVIGDITGFAAACYQRGIRFIQIPTTLLAQVDSSVGGKTGVNHALGKNMIGAFHQPICVIADTAALSTLPKRELSAGLAEVIKYGLIHDGSFFNWLEEHMDALLACDETALAYAIEHSCRIKAEIVAQDERESGVRALLNFGHTFGHAIETFMRYKQWLHGEAVGCGMMLATALSVQLGWLETETLHRVQTLLNRAGLPLEPPATLDSAHFIELMQRDKKVLDGKLRLILLRDIGRAVISDSVDRATLQSCLRSPLQAGH